VQGELALEYESEFEESVAETNRFFLEIDGLLVPYFVTADGLRFKSGKTALVQFDWIENENQARRLVGNPVYLFKDEIIEVTNETTNSMFLGYRLQDENAQEIGVISAVDNYSGNVVFTLNVNKEEVLVPFNEELLLEMDDENKIVRLRLPEGLFDQ
jgi:16S rRNA processing protein RimM